VDGAVAHACMLILGRPFPFLRLCRRRLNLQGHTALGGGEGDAAVVAEDHGHRNRIQKHERGEGAFDSLADVRLQGSHALPQQDVTVMDSSKKSCCTHETNSKETQEEEEGRREDETETGTWRNLARKRRLPNRSDRRWEGHEYRRRVSGARRRRRRRRNIEGDIVLGPAVVPPPEGIQPHDSKPTKGREADEEDEVLNDLQHGPEARLQNQTEDGQAGIKALVKGRGGRVRGGGEELVRAICGSDKIGGVVAVDAHGLADGACQHQEEEDEGDEVLGHRHNVGGGWCGGGCGGCCSTCGMGSGGRRKGRGEIFARVHVCQSGGAKVEGMPTKGV